MTGGDTNVFFVPYRPHSTPDKSHSVQEPKISQQKHAAREYHRKAKLERLAKLNAVHDRHARSTSVPATQPQSESSSRPILPRNRSFQGDQVYDNSFVIFDIGIGQLDPFNACVPAGVPTFALDILDYAPSAQWKIFNLAKGVGGEGTIQNALLACAMQSPAAFWSIIFAGATHHAYLQGGTDAGSRDRTLRLSYKTNAIKELNREIQGLQGVASDELLLAIITMAAHGSCEQLDPPPQEESLSTLESVQNFQYYGRMRWEEAHFKAVAHLVRQRGGLHTVKMPGLANAIALADIFFAFQNLRSPAFPLLAPSTLIMSIWAEDPAPLASSFSYLASGFDEFSDHPCFAPLVQAITHARMITIGLNAYQSQQPGAPTITRIVWARNFMTHDLLSLPVTIASTLIEHTPGQQPHGSSASTIVHVFSPQQALYNLIRLSTLTYTLLILFPMPRVTGLHARLSMQLMTAIDNCTALDLWATHAKILLWATVLGGIASEDALRKWYAEMIRQNRATIADIALGDSSGRNKWKDTSRQRSHNRSRSNSGASSRREPDVTWKVVKDVLFRFLWFDGPRYDGLGSGFWDGC
ncbi:hypothetical protein A1O7_01717 [Cladophialophora yegresii CBS 114405]|uniref:Transcription factor domain-containing protein n=1 Tax=Cladophialophora yegresii CBS 114405 TaxID=1182544 RepID=W9WLB5_9EURO|nr:uncharacterized protein A1O7_01717 [Cladophialophora yegresii CBS 114405]EXJ65376.1 hypothetical protein A1O7_01717 [Cladophialophora yegresii CBS 114405]